MFGIVTIEKEGIQKILLEIDSMDAELQVHHCPKPVIVSLHLISSMSDCVKKIVIHNINITRQGPGGQVAAFQRLSYL